MTTISTGLAYNGDKAKNNSHSSENPSSRVVQHHHPAYTAAIKVSLECVYYYYTRTIIIIITLL